MDAGINSADEKRRMFSKLLDDSWKAESWAEAAINLRRASEILFAAHTASRAEDGEPLALADLELNIPATLLYGYSMENAIKAVLIKENGVTMAKAKVDKFWKTHDLVELAGCLKTLEKSEGLLLATLTAFINWAGKYPAAFKLEGKTGFILSEQYAHNEIDVCEHMPPDVFDSSSRTTANKLLDAFIERVLPKVQSGTGRILRPETTKDTVSNSGGSTV